MIGLRPPFGCILVLTLLVIVAAVSLVILTRG